MCTSRFGHIFDMIEQMHSATSLEGLHQVCLDGLLQIIPGECCDMVLCGVNVLGGEQFFATPETYTRDEVGYMLSHAGEHPVVQAYERGASGALSISQFASDREWRSSGLFSQGGYKRLGLHHEVALNIVGSSKESLAAISIIRRRPDFSDCDREIMNRLQPHIARNWIRIQTMNLGKSPILVRHLFPVLSERESEVLFWILEGKQNLEIAAILERKLGTIQEHVENIIGKLEMENRHQMTVSLLRKCFDQPWSLL